MFEGRAGEGCYSEHTGMCYFPPSLVDISDSPIVMHAQLKFRRKLDGIVILVSSKGYENLFSLSRCCCFTPNPQPLCLSLSFNCKVMRVSVGVFSLILSL